MRKQSEKWDRFYLELAKFVATKLSKDPSTKVGAVVVNWEKGLEFFGYNGFPEGVQDLPERYNDRPTKYALVEHAERNALYKAGRHNAQGATLYVWPAFAFPPLCADCCKAVIGHGIKEVVAYNDPGVPQETVKRWEESIKFSRLMCEERGIIWRKVDLLDSSSSSYG